ncbi:hypothetical protein SAMN05216251_115122 [Actinacidiphila alni]|uniref:Type VII secretion system-associated protein n=1 Tax=Actinacidiphila alni TaxID=380248 RepID=A0A1I2J0F2_9ACTN|nr:type VII secretion system-associated protein [Actinacidiphila alni]SFF47488.1 hypothetical protein SAMN05216251_115122 [Actinacidiphila alni]
MPGEQDLTDLTKLDVAALRSFIDHGLTDFQKAITTLRTKPANGSVSLYDMAGDPRPFVIAGMDQDADTGADKLVSNATTVADSIDTVLNKHAAAFTDLKANLNDVIKTMLDTQDQSLTSVDGQKFLSAVEEYEADLGGGSNALTDSLITQ